MKKVLCIEPYGLCKIGNWYKLDYETTSEWTIILPPDSISIYTSMKALGIALRVRPKFKIQK